MKKKTGDPRKWLIGCLIMVAAALLLVGGLTAIIDPYFLYHKPIPGISYQLDNERYQNYGIARTFDYDALIVGTSMSENFKPSEFDALFHVKSVKLPFSGGSHCEVKELLEFAFAHQENVKCVIRNIDLFRAFDGKDDRDYPLDSYPKYLSDDNPLNDVSYLLNWEIFVKGTMMDLARTALRKPTQTLDEYANWNDAYVFGPAGVQAHYSRDKVEYTGNGGITEEEYERIRENFEGTREYVVRMLAGENVDVNVTRFLNTMDSFHTRDDVFTYLIHLGYLAYDKGTKTCRIPNREVRQEWFNAIETDPNYSVTNRIIESSKQLLADTIAGDEEAVAKALDESHIHVTSNRSYNNEDALGSAIYLAYIYALNDYTCVREMTAGKGFADVIYIPVHSGNPDRPAMIIELKRNDSPGSALGQIDTKQYYTALEHYRGQLLFVGTDYDEKEKTHSCKLQWFEKG